MEKLGHLEQIFIENAIFEYLPIFDRREEKMAKMKEWEMRENDRNKINDYCFLHYTTSCAFWRIALNIFSLQKTSLGGSTMRPQGGE